MVAAAQGERRPHGHDLARVCQLCQNWEALLHHLRPRSGAVDKQGHVTKKVLLLQTSTQRARPRFAASAPSRLPWVNRGVVDPGVHDGTPEEVDELGHVPPHHALLELWHPKHCPRASSGGSPSALPHCDDVSVRLDEELRIVEAHGVSNKFECDMIMARTHRGRHSFFMQLCGSSDNPGQTRREISR